MSDEREEVEVSAVAAVLSGVRWGFLLDGGTFVSVPKLPLLLAGLSAPCDVKMPDGSVRHIIEEP